MRIVTSCGGIDKSESFKDGARCVPCQTFELPLTYEAPNHEMP